MIYKKYAEVGVGQGLCTHGI